VAAGPAPTARDHRRCLLKALHGFLSVDEYAPIKLKTLQLMAS
jgi:hypothetical protein